MKLKPFSQYCWGVCVYVLCGVYACVYMCVLIVNASDCLYLQVIEETKKDSWETVVWL